MSSLSVDLSVDQWLKPLQEEKKRLEELKLKERKKKMVQEELSNRTGGVVVEAFHEHDNTRIIANEYVEYNPKMKRHEIVDNTIASPHIKTIASIASETVWKTEPVHCQGYMSVEYTTYEVVTEKGEKIKWQPDVSASCFSWKVPYWFIIEPSASSTSKKCGSSLKLRY